MAASGTQRKELDLAVSHESHTTKKSRAPVSTKGVAALLAALVLALAIAGLRIGQAEAQQLDVGTGSIREQQALQLAREFWDNPFLRIATVDRVVVGHGSLTGGTCVDVDVAAVTFFGWVLDRVRVSCDDSTRSLGGG
jgi:hypothetical protein